MIKSKVILHKKGLALLLLFISYNSFSQYRLTGVVTDTTGAAISGASLLVKDSGNSIVSYTNSEDKGKYTITVPKPGEYTLVVNHLGYKKIEDKLKVASQEETITRNFVLEEVGFMLKEVVIEAEAPVRSRGDTLVYDAKALSTGKEAVVEDLLKNIPGITVQKDGKIFYGDSEVEKVMVDGDDLFNKGYPLLTKNMPVQPLDKVEVLQNYSKNKHLKGIEDSKAVALNLTIDEKFRNIWFGNATAGYGNDNRYKASGNLMNFSKNYKNFLNVNGNNAGYDYVGDIASMRYNSADIETIGLSSRTAEIMNISNSVSRIDEARARFNNARSGSLSTIFPLGQNAKLRLNGFLGFDELNTYQNAFTVANFENTFFENTEVNTSKNALRKGYVSAYLNYDISATQMLQTLSTFNSGSNTFTSDYTFNGDSTRERLETGNTYFDQQLTYTRKWKSRNVILLKSRFLTDRIPQEYGIDDYLLGGLFPNDNISAIGNAVKSSKQYAGLEADFKLKQKNSDLIAFTVGYQYNRDNLATRFSFFADGATTEPQGFQSDTEYTVGDLYAKSGYTWKIKKISLGANFNAHQLFNRFENTNGETRSQSPFFINTVVNGTWEVSPDNVLSANYIYNIQNSGIIQVNDAYLLTSSRSFSRGLGAFNQLESSSAGLNFTTKHYLNRYSFSAGITYGRQNDIITYRSQINQNLSLSEAFIIRGGEQSSINLRSHFVIKKLKGSLAIDALGTQAIYYNQVNESGLRKNTMYSQIYSLRWRSSFKSAFNFNTGTEWNFSQIQSDNTFNNTSKYTYLDLQYTVTDKLRITAKGEHYNFGGVDNNDDYFFADIEASYSFDKDKYSIGLDVRNLFNTKEFTTYSVSDIGYSSNSFRLLPRYALLSLRYRF
ncbi:hypothetical protein CHU92_03600 [Flavobacterium cyanobacteriorum]|uniref:Uncharacterized protein n=1 Tax=Flavobacterium cyanobacteriorum TaxID=2022802 RepID=A0A255ZPC7_9FLAO|nr:TonB-dependent receptor [Flavobacterium cyanobacteriorum]OYQ43252.1 hypothetical protein CHU92_03600 [Flavobacterium cyanobacteriorum]